MDDYRIYPKQFQFEKILIEKNTCFMIMPFNDAFNQVYGIIKSETSKHGITCNRADEMDGSQPIVNKIIKGILKSRYIIVDLTSARPNVLYELGIAHSFRDARNILLLKQEQTDYPFDLSHLPYKEYDPQNEYQLRAIVSKFIEESRYISDFRDALEINDITDHTIGGQTNYIDYVQDFFGNKIDNYTQILNGNTPNIDKKELGKVFENYEIFIINNLSNPKYEIVEGIIRIYIKLIVKCEDIEVSREYATRFLDKVLVDGLKDDTIRLSYSTDIMLALAEANKLLSFCLPWIIGYFSKSKSSVIDLNRYKLEHFLMKTENEDINNVIVDSIFHENCHVREHMADIIGAKGIIKGFGALRSRLVVEENWYTIGSIVEAIGRIAPSDEGMAAIEEWLDKNGNRIIEEKQFFLLKHILHAIERLEQDGTLHMDCFRNKYDPYMHENQVGPIN